MEVTGKLIMECDVYEIEHEAGTMTGAGTVFLRVAGQRNVPIHVSKIDAICAGLLRMKSTVEALEAK